MAPKWIGRGYLEGVALQQRRAQEAEDGGEHGGLHLLHRGRMAGQDGGAKLQGQECEMEVLVAAEEGKSRERGGYCGAWGVGMNDCGPWAKPLRPSGSQRRYECWQIPYAIPY